VSQQQPPGPPPGATPGTYGQPPYGPPPGQPPYGPPPGRPSGRASTGLIVAVVVGVLVVVGGGVAAAVLLLGGDEKASTDSPLETAAAFAQAWRDGDCGTLESLLTDEFLEGADSECQPDQISGEPTDPEITEESGDEATAVLTDGGVTYEVQLVRDDGQWLVNGFGLGASTPSAPNASEPEPADGA
jgi:hypothetical protein